MIDSAYLKILAGSPLFSGIPERELPPLIGSLSPRRVRYGDGGIMLHEGERTESVGVLLCGRAEAVHMTAEGRSVTFARLAVGSVFGYVLSSADSDSPVTIVAEGECEAVYFPVSAFLSPRDAGAVHFTLLKNMLCESGNRYFALQARVALLTERQLRRKLNLYFSELRARCGSDRLTLDMDRAHLAAYLGCDRSALCRELSRMRDEGLIELKSRSVRLLAGEKKNIR